jgi:hypothetical protein
MALYGTTSEGHRIVLYGVDPWPDLTIGEHCGAPGDLGAGDLRVSVTCNRPAGHEGRHGFIEYQDDGSVEHRYWA